MSIDLKMPPALVNAMSRFDRLSLRERGLLFAAVLIVVVTAWNVTVMDDLSAREKRLTAEVTELQTQLATTSRATATLVESDPTTRALAQLEERKAALDAINARLASESAGLIPPSQMVQVIRDVLSHQEGLTLVSLQNLPMTSLSPPGSDASQTAVAQAGPPESSGGAGASGAAVSSADSATTTPEGGASGAESTRSGAAALAADTGPYLHPVQLVVEGNYLDIVAYLHALEGLPWHFYWRVLELETKTYPRNRVRIELSTVSLEKEWIGV
jgi:MSHA biogenesis protein MshJ